MAEQVYQPRNPKASPRGRCVDAHFEEFLQVYSERYHPRYGVLRDVIPEVVGKFLECGDLEKGFARVRCPECRHEFLVAFSCKARWFCPTKASSSCARRKPKDSAQGQSGSCAQLGPVAGPSIWEADPLTCPDCGAEMRILAFIGDRVIGRILRHLGLLPTPRAVRRSRSPSTSRSTTTCPPWKRKTLSISPSERPKSLRRRPVLASRRPPRPPGSRKTRPNQREKLKTALNIRSGIPANSERAGRKSVSAPKPNLEGDVLLLDPKIKFLSLFL